MCHSFFVLHLYCKSIFKTRAVSETVSKYLISVYEKPVIYYISFLIFIDMFYFFQLILYVFICQKGKRMLFSLLFHTDLIFIGFYPIIN